MAAKGFPDSPLLLMRVHPPVSYTDAAKLVRSLIDGACTTNSMGEVARNQMRWIHPPKS